MISNRAKFVSFKQLNDEFSMNIIDDFIISIVDIEIINLKIIFVDDIIQTINLHDVFYVFVLSIKLFFTIQIISHDDTIFFDENECIIKNKKIEKIILHVIKCRNFYSLNLIKKIEIYTTNTIQFEHIITINYDFVNL